jgi:hypothetical protein
MRRKPSAFLILVFFLGLLRGICAENANQTNSTPVIVVSNLGGSKADVPGWQPAVGQGISEMLVESLEDSDKKFQVLETAETTGSQNESKSDASNSAGGGTKSARSGSADSKMSATNDVASSEKSDTSSPADSDFTFSGEVMQFTIQTNSSKVGDFISSSPFAGLNGKLYTAHVQIEWRLVDSETKKVVKRGITAISASGSDFDMEALATTAGSTSAVASATSLVKTTAHSKPPAAAQSGANNLASAQNFFSGLNKAFGNASSSGSGGSSAGGNSGIAAKSSAKSPNTAPKTATAGDVAATDTETISYGNPTFINSALGKATAKAVTDIIKQLDAINLPKPGRVTKVKTANDALKHTPGKVLAVADKDAIIVSLGSKEGLKAGDTLELYQPSDVLDDKSNVVFSDEKLVGEITLQSVQDDKSRASYSGDVQVKQGWTVKAK